jgi:Tat protein translocase TatB subunit
MDFFGIGTTEILMVLVVTLIAFGPSKIPELARHLAKFMKMMREASSELQRQLESQEWAKIKRQRKHTYSSPIQRLPPLLPKPVERKARGTTANPHTVRRIWPAVPRRNGGRQRTG